MNEKEQELWIKVYIEALSSSDYYIRVKAKDLAVYAVKEYRESCTALSEVK